MKKLFKKGITVLLLLALLSSTFGANMVLPVYAANIGNFGGVHWELDNQGVLTFTVLDGANGQFGSGQGNWANQSPDIKGDVKKIVFADAIQANQNSSELFKDLTNLEYIENLDKLDTSNVSDMNRMFHSCEKLIGKSDTEPLDFSSFNTADVTSMELMFYHCYDLLAPDFSSFTTGNVADMHGMFHGCESFQTLNLSSFNTKNVTTMKTMFTECDNLTSITFGENFKTDKVTEMWSMFKNCEKLEELDLSGFNTENVTTFKFMFQGCESLERLDISDFDTTTATDSGASDAFKKMFKDDVKLSYLVLGKKTKLPNTSLENPPSTSPYNKKWIEVLTQTPNLTSSDIMSSASPEGIYIWQQDTTPKVKYQFEYVPTSVTPPATVTSQLPGDVDIAIGPSYQLAVLTNEDVTDDVNNGKWFFKGYSLQGTSQIITEIAPVDSYDPFTVVGKWQFKPAVVADNPNDDGYVKVKFSHGVQATGFAGAVDSEVWALKNTKASDVFVFAALAYNADDNLLIDAGYNFKNYTDAADAVVDAMTTVGTSDQEYTAQYDAKPAVVATDQSSDPDYVKVIFSSGLNGNFVSGVKTPVWALKNTAVSTVFNFANLATNSGMNIDVNAGFGFSAYHDADDNVVTSGMTVATTDQTYTAQYAAIVLAPLTTTPEAITVGEIYDLTDNIIALPVGATVTDVTTAGAINVDVAGNYTGVVKVIHSNGMVQFVEVLVIVSPLDDDDDGDDNDDGNNDGNDDDGNNDDDDGNNDDDDGNNDGNDDDGNNDDDDDADSIDNISDADDEFEGDWIIVDQAMLQQPDDAVIDQPAAETVSYLSSTRGFSYIMGYPDGYVRPQGHLTRAEAVTIFFRLLASDVRDKNITKENDFSDVKRLSWYNQAVSTMAKLDVVKGYPDGQFRPDTSISRAQFIALLARFTLLPETRRHYFSDTAGHWAQDLIDRVADRGWVEGYLDNSFKPNQSISRAEAMTLINRMLRLVPESKADLLANMLYWRDNRDEQKWYYLAVQTATNSHVPEWRDDGFERWRSMTPNFDWTTYEK